MTDLLARLANVVPTWPRRRYCVYSGTNDWNEWRDMLRYGLFTDAPSDAETVAAYEEQFAAAAGTRYAFSFGAGRMALYVLLEAMGIGAGDEIIIPAFTCVVVPNALLYRGARPVYADIDLRTFNIDPNVVEDAITPRTRALYAQHSLGIPCDIDALREIGRRRGLPVIEDAAHALGATYRGAAVGSLTEAAFFSTDHSKMIGTMMGGMVTTSDPRLADRLRRIQQRTSLLPAGVVRRLVLTFLLEQVLLAPESLWLGRSIHAVLARTGPLFYFRDELMTQRPTAYPYPCQLPAPLAALGRSQLDKLAANLAHRRMIARWLEDRIGWYRNVPGREHSSPSWLRYSFLIKDRDSFVRRFRDRFDLAVWFTSVVNGRNRDLQAVAYSPGSCPRAEHVVEHIVNFPTHPRIPLAVLQRQWERHGSWVAENVLCI